jgi:hypothetical protein
VSSNVEPQFALGLDRLADMRAITARRRPALLLFAILLLLAASSVSAAALTPRLREVLGEHDDVSHGSDDTHAALASLSARFRRQPPPVQARGTGGRLSKPPAGVCPPELEASVNDTGLLPVDYFRGANVTCDQATRLAINMSANACGGVVYFASSCDFESTVIVPGGICLHGGGSGGGDEFSFRPQTHIGGPKQGPAFLVEHVTNVQFQALEIEGWNTGVIVTDSAVVRFTNVAIHADAQGVGADDVNLTATGCSGCNVVLGSNNTALVIENSFWVWAEDCSFYFYPLYRDAGPSPATHDHGQRPSVIIRGNTPGHFGINTVYLLHFGRIVVSGGGFQYQQLVAGDQWPGFYDFNWVTSEVSATPLLDVQVAPGLEYFAGLQAVTIYDYNAADVSEPHYMRDYPALTPESVKCEGKIGQCPGLVAITALNCSGATGCALDGLTIIAASGYEGMGSHVPAVRVWDGTVTAVTTFGSQLTGATDCVDGENKPIGSWVGRSGGGFVIVGTANDSEVGNAKLSAAGGDTHSNGNASDINNFIGAPGSAVGHALLVGESGEMHARLAIETSGAMRWGDGDADSFHTTLRKVRSSAMELDLAPIKPGSVATTRLALEGALETDLVTAGLSSLGEAMVSISARVSKKGEVFVLFRNDGDAEVDVERGTLRAAATSFS